MNNGIITKSAALRIALAARTMDDVDVAALATRIGDHLGLPITEEKLAKLTVADLKLMLSGEETVEPDVDPASLKLAVRQLWGDAGDVENLPKPQPYREGTCRAACAWPSPRIPKRMWTGISVPVRASSSTGGPRRDPADRRAPDFHHR